MFVLRLPMDIPPQQINPTTINLFTNETVNWNTQ